MAKTLSSDILAAALQALPKHDVPENLEDYKPPKHLYFKAILSPTEKKKSIGMAIFVFDKDTSREEFEEITKGFQDE